MLKMRPALGSNMLVTNSGCLPHVVHGGQFGSGCPCMLVVIPRPSHPAHAYGLLANRPVAYIRAPSAPVQFVSPGWPAIICLTKILAGKRLLRSAPNEGVNRRVVLQHLFALLNSCAHLFKVLGIWTLGALGKTIDLDHADTPCCAGGSAIGLSATDAYGQSLGR